MEPGKKRGAHQPVSLVGALCRQNFGTDSRHREVRKLRVQAGVRTAKDRRPALVPEASLRRVLRGCKNRAAAWQVRDASIRPMRDSQASRHGTYLFKA